MRLTDLNLIKANREIEAIKVRLDELMLCLADREQKILEAIEDGKQRDMSTAEIIETQKAAISKLEDLNCEKTKSLTGLTRWIILAILGVMSLTVRYDIQYSRGEGVVIKPSSDSGLILPAAYTLSIIAIASNQDSKIGSLIEKLGDKLG